MQSTGPVYTRYTATCVRRDEIHLITQHYDFLPKLNNFDFSPPLGDVASDDFDEATGAPCFAPLPAPLLDLSSCLWDFDGSLKGYISGTHDCHSPNGFGSRLLLTWIGQGAYKVELLIEQRL
ncbi:unnamed protein product [Sphagnum balticum]